MLRVGGKVRVRVAVGRFTMMNWWSFFGYRDAIVGFVYCCKCCSYCCCWAMAGSKWMLDWRPDGGTLIVSQWMVDDNRLTQLALFTSLVNTWPTPSSPPLSAIEWFELVESDLVNDWRWTMVHFHCWLNRWCIWVYSVTDNWSCWFSVVPVGIRRQFRITDWNCINNCCWARFARLRSPWLGIVWMSMWWAVVEIRWFDWLVMNQLELGQPNWTEFQF